METLGNEALYFEYRKTKIGYLTRLAVEEGAQRLNAGLLDDGSYSIVSKGLKLKANLKKGRGKRKGQYIVDGCVIPDSVLASTFYSGVNINGVGLDNEELRPAQKGAIHGLLCHWSLSNEPATVVLPTGTGKTETMLVATLVDKAKRTLVIVPTIELKSQIAGKFGSWGILRELGVLPESAPNPCVLTLDKTVLSEEDLEAIELADVVVTTPALIARATQCLHKNLANSFSHVYFDEAHHVQANEWNSIKSLFSDSKIVQFTATPYRHDKKPIEGKIVYNYPLSQALMDNCFSNISLVTIDERHPRKKDKAIADAAISRLREDRKKGWTKHRVMVRTGSQKQADKLFLQYQQWFPEERIVLIHNKTPGKKEIIKRIKSGEYDIVVCVDMLKEGFDYPEFKIAAVHSVHKSLGVLLQFIGRFTRTRKDLGDASFVVNYAEEKMSLELENLFQDGTGWENVISEIADAKKVEAESLLSFLQGCKPYSGFDSADIELNPKLVYPALSCLCFQAEKVDWGAFKGAFNLSHYSLSQPYINEKENVFYFTTQKREQVKWARSNKMRDQNWDLIVMHFDDRSKLLYIGYTEKSLDIDNLVDKLTNKEPELIKGDCVFRSFDSIKRLSIIHAGIFKPANHLHRYSKLSGADVSTELERWKEGKRCKKSDFVGIGYRGGFPVSVGASVKGKIWSPSRRGDLKEWKLWCLEIGKLITDESIDSNQLLEDSAQKVQIESYPDDLIVLSTDWSEDLYDRIHKITLEHGQYGSYLLSEAKLKLLSTKGKTANFVLKLLDQELSFKVVLGSENGHEVRGLNSSGYHIEGLKATPISLEQFFQEYPPTMFLLNGCTIAGCIHTDYGEEFIQSIPNDKIVSVDWEDTDFTIESYYKSDKPRQKSIQEFMMRRMVEEGATVVFNDDNSGESSDIVAIFLEDELIRFNMIHCKYSKEKSGARKSDLYEVCGQAIISLRYKWKTEELLKHLDRRNRTGVLNGKRFYHGETNDLIKVKQALKYCNVEFEFAIAQPGVAISQIDAEMSSFLNSIYSTVIEMTETQLKCYFSA
ncbi:DEAD/DEAH box helicase family protein [Vibrio alginolyticus]|nr:DEAD/DEAH box helicase family protein [Vibrio alginolyticus]